MGQHYLKCSVLFRSEPIRSADTTEYFTNVGTSTKRSLRNGLIQDLLSSTSPPTVVETHGDFNRRFSNRNSKKSQLSKQSGLRTTFYNLAFFFFLIHCIKAFLWDLWGAKSDSNHEKQTLKRSVCVFFYL